MTVVPRLCQTTPAVTRVHIKFAGAITDAYVRAQIRLSGCFVPILRAASGRSCSWSFRHV